MYSMKMNIAFPAYIFHVMSFNYRVVHYHNSQYFHAAQQQNQLDTLSKHKIKTKQNGIQITI